MRGTDKIPRPTTIEHRRLNKLVFLVLMSEGDFVLDCGHATVSSRRGVTVSMYMYAVYVETFLSKALSCSELKFHYFDVSCRFVAATLSMCFFDLPWTCCVVQHVDQQIHHTHERFRH